jgi:phenylacetate-CoA ligase
VPDERELHADRYWQPDEERATRADIEALQEAKLVEMVRWAYERAPLYRSVWDAAGVGPDDVRTLDDYRERIPFIDKDTIRRFRDETGDPYGGLLCVDPSELTGISSTSGTTGDPTLIPEKWDAGGSGPGLSRDFWEMGVRPGDHVVLPMFTFRGPIYNFPHALGAVPVILDHDPAILPFLHDLCLELRPRAWYSMSGPMVLGLRALERDGLPDGRAADLRDMFASFDAVVFAGEPLGSRAAADLDRWGITVFHHSAAGDVGAAFECREHDGLHVWEDVGLYECLDPDGSEPVSDGGTGELVASSLDNRVMPLLRFRSDDIDRFTRETCGCGRTHARLWTLGRKGDEVVVDGRSVLPLDVWSAVEALDECQAGLFQIIRTARECDVLRLRVGHDGVGGPDLRDRVADSVEAAVGVRPAVELVPNAELLRLGPPHKIPRVARR